MFGVDGTDAAYDSPGATSITSIYDEGGHPIEHLFHDSGGELITHIDFRHDERGNLVEEVCSQQKLPPEMIVDISPEQLAAVRMLFTFRRHHRYDEQDRRIETSSNIIPKDIDLETFAYNDHGDVIRTFRSRRTRNTLLEKKERLHQNRIALARIGRKRSFAISTILTAIGSRRLLKLLAARSGV